MSKITTEDCKFFLVSHFYNQGITTQTKEWKRNSKYKEHDYWVREFSHATIGIVSLIENSNLLMIKKSNKKERIESSYFKAFSQEDVNGAKKLVQKLINVRQESEDDDLVFETKDWEKYKHALPSQFTFYFPFENPDEIYHNDLNNVVNGLDSPLIFNNYESFNVMFNDKNTDDIDLYTNDCLNTKISGVLPSWTDFIDEYHLEATTEAPKDLTVKDFIHVLFDLGFEYKIGRQYDCLFKEEMKDYISQLKIKSNNNLSKPKF